MEFLRDSLSKGCNHGYISLQRPASRPGYAMLPLTGVLASRPQTAATQPPQNAQQGTAMAPKRASVGYAAGVVAKARPRPNLAHLRNRNDSRPMSTKILYIVENTTEETRYFHADIANDAPTTILRYATVRRMRIAHEIKYPNTELKECRHKKFMRLLLKRNKDGVRLVLSIEDTLPSRTLAGPAYYACQ